MKISPKICKVINGVKATIEIIPKPSTRTFAPSIDSAAPCANASKKVAVIGAGGAARAIAMKVALDGAEHIDIVNRTVTKALELSAFITKKTGVPVRALSMSETEEKNILWQNEIIINTTSLGMYPDTDGCPIDDFSCIRKNHIFYDIIYNPLKTKLLEEAEKQGCKVINGLGMLIYQGIYAYEIWTGSKVPETIKDELFMQLSPSCL